MPPRSKQNLRQVDWLACQNCCCRFSSRDVELHSELCSDTSPFKAERINLNSLNHGYVKDNVLVAILTLADGKEVNKSTSKDENKAESVIVRENLLKQKNNRIVFVNPATMSVLGLSILRPAVINNQHILLAWPDAGLPLATVAVSEVAARTVLNKRLKDTVIISVLKGVELAATEVHVRPRQKKACIYEKHFLPYLQKRLVGGYVAVGNRLSMCYLASVCELDVVKISVENGEVIDCDESIGDIDNEMSRLNLTSPLTQSSPSAGVEQLTDIHDKCALRFFRLLEETSFVLADDVTVRPLSSVPPSNLDDVGGLDSQKALLLRLVKLMLNHQNEELADCYGVRVPRAVLLHGPSGTGKTLLAKALVHSARLHLVPIGGSSVLSPYVGESEKRIEQLFIEARRSAPSLILIDEIDSLCPRRHNTQNDIERRVTAALCSQIDAILSEDCQVFIIGATRRKDEVSAALLSATRFGVEQEISIPNSQQRSQILECQLRAVKHQLSCEDMASIAGRAHGYVGADLAAVCREAWLSLIGRRASSPDDSMTSEDMSHGLKMVVPSAMKELAIEKPNVTWEDIGGMKELKQRLEEAIILPIRDPELFTRMGAKPPKGHLLYGPPGCSKTMIAKALATECDINFIAVQSSSLMSKWVGESEKSVRELFRKARAASPAIIFFDEFDAVAGTRGRDGGGTDVVDRVLSQLLTEIDGVVELKNVSILAATNRPDLIDPALKRPGRLGAEVYVGLPNDDTRREIFRVSFRRMPVADDVSLDELVLGTEGYTGAEVKAVVDKAAWLSAIEVVAANNLSDCRVHRRHFDAALADVPPRTTAADLKFFDDYTKRSSRR